MLHCGVSILHYQTPVCVCSVRLVSPLLKCGPHFPPRALFCWIQHFWQKLPPWMLMRRSLVLEGQVELVNNLKVCLAGVWRVASNKLSIWGFAAKTLACYKVGKMRSKKRGIPVHLTLIRHKASLTFATFFYVSTVIDSPAKLFSTVNMQ